MLLSSGMISVRVVDALTGIPVSGAFVQVSGPITVAAISDALGAATISGLPAGLYDLEVTHTGYQATTQPGVEPGPSPTTAITLPLSASLAIGQYRFVLTWLATPRDLDIHLLVPADSANPGGSEIYYAARGDTSAYPFALLDHDLTTGYGPETITLHQVHGSVYRLFIHRYSSDTALSASGAKLRVYDHAGQQNIVTIPPGDPTMRYWYVLDFDGGTGQVTVRNTLQSGPPTRAGLKRPSEYPRKVSLPRGPSSIWTR